MFPITLCMQAVERCSKVRPASAAELRLSTQSMQHTDQPQALASALEHLSHLQPHISELVLTHFTMSNALAEVLTAAVSAKQGWGGVRLTLDEVFWPADQASTLTAPLPPLHALSFAAWPGNGLTNSVLAQLQQSGTTISELRMYSAANSLLLTTPVPPGTRLPFDKIRYRDGGNDWLHHLVEQAALVGPSVPWEDVTLYLTLASAQVSTGTQSIVRCIAHCPVHGCGAVHSTLPVCMCLYPARVYMPWRRATVYQ